MAQSKNPAKKAAPRPKKAVGPRKATSAAEFKKRGQGTFLELPASGFVVKAKRVELQSFVLQGNVPNPLMEIVSSALEKGQKADIPAMMGVEEGKLDLDMVRDMYEIVNGIVVASMIEPQVHPVPTRDDVLAYNAENPDAPVKDPEELRSDDELYVDEVDDEDKMFLFQWNTGGTSDVETFRRESRADMDALAEIQGDQ